MDYQKYIDKLMDLAISYGPKVILAIIVLIFGITIINNLVKAISKILAKRDTDPTLSNFLLSIVGWLLKLLLFISVASMIGIETTSFIAVLSAMTLAVGMALQGSLANFAGGALILLFRPIKVGELIEAQGVTGHVKEIQMFTTILATPHNKMAVIPNGALANGNIINFSRLGSVRVDIDLPISGDQDIDKVRSAVVQVMQNNSKVLKTPAPTANINKIEGGITHFILLPYCTPEDYWDVFFGVQEDVKKALGHSNIALPMPHQVVIHKNV